MGTIQRHLPTMFIRPVDPMTAATQGTPLLTSPDGVPGKRKAKKKDKAKRKRTKQARRMNR